MNYLEKNKYNLDKKIDLFQIIYIFYIDDFLLYKMNICKINIHFV